MDSEQELAVLMGFDAVQVKFIAQVAGDNEEIIIHYFVLKNTKPATDCFEFNLHFMRLNFM
jgi:hypothetical protein